MSKKNHKIAILDGGRERFSNFVVDLRPREEHAAQKIKPEISGEEKKIKKGWRAKFKNFKPPFKSIGPNLLQTSLRPAAAPKPKSRILKPGRPSRPANSWQKFVRAQAAIFNRPHRPTKLKAAWWNIGARRRTVAATSRPDISRSDISRSDVSRTPEAGGRRDDPDGRPSSLWR